MKVLVIDIGGTNIKIWCPNQKQRFKVRSGADFAPEDLVKSVKKQIGSSWGYDAITIGVPAPVNAGSITDEPLNLRKGWVNYSFEKSFCCPTKIINDAAMQAVGSYNGGRMLFMGLGTGLGMAMIVNYIVIPLEAQHLPFKKNFTFEQLIGKHGRISSGSKKWEKNLNEVVSLFSKAFLPEEIVLGGGLVKHLRQAPHGVRLGDNKNAIEGGIRLWSDPRYVF